MHLPIPGYAGLMPGSYYGFTSDSTEPAQIIKMINDCGNVVVFSGHTHFNFATQEKYPNITVRPIAESHSYTVHIPSAAYPRDSNSVQKSLESEGYIVEVYQDVVLLKGLDFVSKKFVPIGLYALDIAGSDRAIPASLSLAEGETKTLKLRGNYSQAVWSTADASIATVENGVVTGVKAGTVTITATVDGVAHTCEVTVSEPVPVTLSVGDTTITMRQTLTVKVSGTVYSPDITWVSDNPAVATVKNGVITGVSAGTATITVTVDGKDYSIKITVTNPLGNLSGSGTQSDPYIISSALDFVDFQNASVNGDTFSGSYFLQTAHINLSDCDGFQPFNNANRTAVFAGHYNGNGYTITAAVPRGISNFTAAFFWDVSGTIINCGFNVTHAGASETTYGVCRKMTGGKMINCYVTGSLVGVNDYTSVIGGTSSGALLNNIYVDVAVTGGGSAVSGVTIKGAGNNVTNCYYTDNGLKSNYAGETKVTAEQLKTTVADTLNDNLPAVAAATGIDIQLLCNWAKVDNGNPVLISK